MCGIVGQTKSDGSTVQRGLLDQMCAALEHRGPDSRGLHVENECGLGIQRLRVIDLESGDQPIYNEDGSIVVVLNGEIYNYAELRRELQAAGHVFATKGDTEVIVHLYEEKGLDAVRSLHGMFALALWDARRRRLVVARDRVGKKPLFYSVNGSGLSFASELRSLMRDPEIPREIDPQALDCFLAYGYIQAPLSIFRGVRKLPPATQMVYEAGRVELSRYWQLRYDVQRPVDDREELLDEIRETLRRAVRRRMIADVPLGAFLSGGIDSSAVVCAMSEASSQPVKTFSIGFEDDDFNELPHARRVAELFDTEHHEFVVRPDPDIVPRVIRQYGEPFADASAIPSFYVSELTRRHVTVALNGDGGDESFGGYTRYVSNSLAARLARLPAPIRRGTAATARRLPGSGKIDSSVNRVKRLAHTLQMNPAARYAHFVSYFDAEQRAQLYSPAFAASIGDSVAEDVIARPWGEASGRTPVDVMLEVDVASWLPGDLLVKMDIASMAYSLEARSPFLDTEMMELAASIPSEHKVRGMEKKVILRDALRPWLPDDLLDRPKRGFAVPLSGWFRDELRDWTREILLDRSTLDRGYFNEDYVRAMLDAHLDRREDAFQRIWALVVFELWHRDLVDNADSVPAVAAA